MPTVEIVEGSFGELAALEVQFKPLGFSVEDIETGDLWILTRSTAGVDHVDVETVDGKPDLRWVRDQGGGAADFEGYAEQFVSRDGDNANDGTRNSPKLTGLSAWLNLADGGTMYVAADADGTGPDWSDGTEAAGFVAGQGFWDTGNSTTVPTGFVAQRGITIQGIGNQTAGQFGTQAVYLPWGQRDYTPPFRRNPAVWMVNQNSATTFRNCRLLANQPVRIGVDYIRNNDAGYSVCELPVTAASRSAGATTLTVDSLTFPIVSIKREAGVTTVLISHPTAVPYRYLSQFYLDAGSLAGAHPAFPVGTYTVGYLTSDPSPGIHEIKFDDASTDVALATPVGGTVTGHGALADDWIELQSETSFSGEFPSTMYQITSTPDVGTIIVRDKLGGIMGRATTVADTDIGTWALQWRAAGCAFNYLIDCEIQTMFGGQEKLMMGPGIDRGDSAAGDWAEVIDCDIHGSVPDDGLGFTNWDHIEIARAAGHFVQGYNGVGFVHKDGVLIQGNIYVPQVTGPGGSSFITVDHVTQEGNFGAVECRPCVEFVEGYFGACYINSVANVDTPNTIGVDLGSCSGPATIINTIRMGGPTRDYNQLPVVIGSPSPVEGGVWSNVSSSFEADRLVGPYASDGRLAAKLDLDFGGVYQGRTWRNVLPENMADAAAWIPTGAATCTGGQPDKDGGNNAFLVSGAGGLTNYLLVTAATAANPVGPAAVGDVYAMHYWVKVPSGALLNGRLSILNNNFTGQWWDFISPFGGDGEWQRLTVRAANTWAGAGALWELRFYSQGVDFLVYQPTLAWLPLATYSRNEQARIATRMRARPEYLIDGAVGTMPGVQLYGDGGIGTRDYLTVGVASGNVTIGAANGLAVAIRNPADGTVLGWLPLYAGTVVP